MLHGRSIPLLLTLKEGFLLFRINHQLPRIRNRLQERIKIIENTFLNHHQISSLSAIWKVPESIKIILIRNTFFNQSIQHCKFPQIEGFQYHITETFLLFYSNRFCQPGSPFLLRSRQIPCPAPSRAQETPSPSPELFSFFVPQSILRLHQPFFATEPANTMPGAIQSPGNTIPKPRIIFFFVPQSILPPHQPFFATELSNAGAGLFCSYHSS